MSEKSESAVVNDLLAMATAEYETEVDAGGRPADVVFPDHGLALEVKKYDGPSAKGIGQAAIYRTAGHESYVVHPAPFDPNGIDLNHPALPVGAAVVHDDSIEVLARPDEYEARLGDVFRAVDEPE